MKRLVVFTLGCLVLGLSTSQAEPPSKKDMPKFIKDLKAKDAKMRLAAIENIAQVGEVKAVHAKEAAEPLGEVLVKDDDAKVREAAAKALPRIDAEAEKAVPPLIDRLKNEKDRAALEAVVTGWAYTGSPLRGSSTWRCPKCKAAPLSARMEPWLLTLLTLRTLLAPRATMIA